MSVSIHLQRNPIQSLMPDNSNPPVGNKGTRVFYQINKSSQAVMKTGVFCTAAAALNIFFSVIYSADNFNILFLSGSGIILMGWAFCLRLYHLPDPVYFVISPQILGQLKVSKDSYLLIPQSNPPMNISIPSNIHRLRLTQGNCTEEFLEKRSYQSIKQALQYLAIIFTGFDVGYIWWITCVVDPTSTEEIPGIITPLSILPVLLVIITLTSINCKVYKKQLEEIPFL